MTAKRYLSSEPKTQSHGFTETMASEDVADEKVSWIGSLLKKVRGAPVTTADKARVLRQAIRDQDLKLVEQMLSSGVDLYEDQEASLPCIATRRQNIALLDLLMRAGVDINQADRRGKTHKSRTPLMEAARRGWYEGVEALIAAKAKFDITDETGATALQLAVRANHTDVVALMLRFGADPNTPTHAKPALACVHEASDVSLMRRLVEYGADIEAVDRQGLTALHYHARAGRVDVVDYLLDLGASPNAPDKSGRTPLFFVGQKGDGLGVLNSLVAADAALNLRDKEDNTCAHLICARADQRDLFIRLYELAPQLFSASNHVGETPASILNVRGYKDLVQELNK